MSRVDASVVTFKTVTVPVPPSGEVRLPGAYAHEFASLPMYWRTISGVTSKYVDFPMLSTPSGMLSWRNIPR